MEKLNITGLTLEEMEQLMASIGQPKYRADQLFTWLYKKRIDSLEQVTVFSKELRRQLSESLNIGHLKIERQQVSSDGDTNKFLFRLKDDHFVESVYIVEGKRRTICLSTQVGCALGCNFCATGNMGFKRNLSVGEIVDQLLTILKTLKVDATNIVFMGMGEPFLNYDNVMKACEVISHSDGLAIGRRKITISTAGIIPKIKQFADECCGYKLAISLNAPDDKKRTQLMPINKKYPINELVNAGKYYASKSRHLFTFEYLMIAGVNDSEDDARKFKRLFKGVRCKINIIPFNSTDGELKPPTEKKIDAFIKQLLDLKIIISVRRSKGADIDAACGQLYHRYEDDF
ncbi:23S rRNA (adenine(2503)-C(2))-methyltransferase RlmN [candidate division KSB1 bacterium]|nr:23S rRNA (adenine(2503)-C(2))-methyltransferase RlmN [candidate division KSB1 bacterium]